MMIPFINMRNFKSNKTQATISNAIKKLEENQLTVEDILDDNELITEIKISQNTQLSPLFTNENIRKLFDYCTKQPESEDSKLGHRFPFNACELLCSDTPYLLDKIFEETKIQLEETDEEEGEHSESSEGHDESHFPQEDICNISHDSLDREETKNFNEEHSDIMNNKINEESQDNLGSLRNGSIENSESNQPIQICSNNMDEIQLENEKPVKCLSPKNKFSSPKKTNRKKAHQRTIANTDDIFFEDQNDKLNTSHHSESSYKENSIKENTEDTKTVYLLLDYFFESLENNILPILSHPSSISDEIISVLTGYFSKLFMHLISQKNNIILRYLLYTKFEYIEKLIEFSNYFSISECLIKILLGNFISETSSETITQQPIDHDYSSELKIAKYRVIETILDSIDIKEDKIFDQKLLDRIENVSQLLLECLSNMKFYHMFMENIILVEKLNKILVSILSFSNNDVFNRQESTKSLLKVLIKINENILKDFGIQVNPFFTNDNGGNFINNEEEITSIVNSLGSTPSPNKILSKLNIKHIEKIIEIVSETAEKVIIDFSMKENSHISFNSTFEKPTHMLGLRKLIAFEYIKSVIEILVSINDLNEIERNEEEHKIHIVLIENVNKFFDVFKRTNFFKVSIDNLFKYEMNNMYQNLFEHMIILITKKSTPDFIIKHMFCKEETCCDFLNTIINYFNNKSDNSFEFNSGNKLHSNLLAILCKISNDIWITENKFLIEILKGQEDGSNQFEIFIETFVNPVKIRFDKGLLIDIKSKVTNLESLNEYEYTEERMVPEGSKYSFNEIIQTGLTNFSNGGLPLHDEEDLECLNLGTGIDQIDNSQDAERQQHCESNNIKVIFEENPNSKLRESMLFLNQNDEPSKYNDFLNINQNHLAFDEAFSMEKIDTDTEIIFATGNKNTLIDKIPQISFDPNLTINKKRDGDNVSNYNEINSNNNQMFNDNIYWNFHQSTQRDEEILKELSKD